MTARMESAKVFARNLAAYGASEVACKSTRLLVVIVMARTLDAVSIGLAATALAASEVLKALTQNGIGQRIIAAPEADLAAVCATARRLFWAWCGGLFMLQVGVGAALWGMGGDEIVFVMIVLLGIEYLFMPSGLVQCFLAMREGRLSSTAAIGAAQVVGANLLTLPMLLIWPSPVAVILPKVLSAPVWLIGMRRLRPWSPDPTAGRAAIRPFLRFGAAILGVEVVKALRLQADKLIIGAILGAEALGIWFFAFNAGLGLATSFSTAFSIVVFPHICRAEDDTARRRAVREALAMGIGLIVPAVVAQAMFAPWYVPLVFGEQWAGAADLVGILCLAAIPVIVWSAAAQWMRAHDRAGAELSATLISTLALMAATAALAPLGLYAVALGYTAVSAVTQLVLSWTVLRGAILPVRMARA